jgi:hypothetical protein
MQPSADFFGTRRNVILRDGTSPRRDFFYRGQSRFQLMPVHVRSFSLPPSVLDGGELGRTETYQKHVVVSFDVISFSAEVKKVKN